MGIGLPNPIFKLEDPATWPLLLPLDFVSRILHLSPWTLRQWDKHGKLPALHVGNRGDRRYKREDIIKILTEGLPKTQLR